MQAIDFTQVYYVTEKYKKPTGLYLFTLIGKFPSGFYLNPNNPIHNPLQTYLVWKSQYSQDLTGIQWLLAYEVVWQFLMIWDADVTA